MCFRNLSKLYFSTLNYRVLYFYFFFYLKFLPLDPITYFVKLCYDDTYIVSFLLCFMVVEDKGEFNYDLKSEKGPSRWERFDPNGACVDMEQCILQLIC